MAAVSLDSVILQLEARVGEYNQQVAASASTTERAMQRIDVAATKTERTLGQNRIGMQQLSYQLNDMTTMWALGARPMQIFASQGGQVIQAIQMMTSASGGFMGLLAGPWGIAITSAITVLASLGSQYLSTADDATTAVSKLDQALARFRAGLAQASDLSQAMTQATRDKVSLLADLGRAQAELRRAEFGVSNNNAMNASDAGSTETAVFAARRRVDAIEGEITAIDRRMQAAIEDQRVQNRVDRLAADQADQRTTATERSTGAIRARTVAVGAEQRAINQQAQATDRFIASLEDEYARLTLSAEQYAAREVFAQRAIAVTDDQRAAIDRLAASLAALHDREVESQRLKDEQAKTDQYDQQRQDKIKQLADEQQQIAEEQISALAGFYQSMFTSGTGSVWDNFKREGLEAITLLAARWTIAMIASGGQSGLGSILGGGKPGGGLGSLFSSLASSFAGARANGGPVAANRTYLVGERGPELFMPQGNGTIVPNQALTAHTQAGGGIATVRLMLSGDIDARIDQRSAGVAVEVVRATSGDIIEGAVSEVSRRARRRTL